MLHQQCGYTHLGTKYDSICAHGWLEGQIIFQDRNLSFHQQSSKTFEMFWIFLSKYTPTSGKQNSWEKFRKFQAVYCSWCSLWRQVKCSNILTKFFCLPRLLAAWYVLENEALKVFGRCHWKTSKRHLIPPYFKDKLQAITGLYPTRMLMLLKDVPFLIEISSTYPQYLRIQGFPMVFEKYQIKWKI